MTNEKEEIIWNKILNVVRKQYSGSYPKIIEVLPDRPIKFHIKDTDGKLSFYTVNYRIDKSAEITIDWSTVEQIDPF